MPACVVGGVPGKLTGGQFVHQSHVCVLVKQCSLATASKELGRLRERYGAGLATCKPASFLDSLGRPNPNKTPSRCALVAVAQPPPLVKLPGCDEAVRLTATHLELPQPSRLSTRPGRPSQPIATLRRSGPFDRDASGASGSSICRTPRQLRNYQDPTPLPESQARVDKGGR